MIVTSIIDLSPEVYQYYLDEAPRGFTPEEAMAMVLTVHALAGREEPLRVRVRRKKSKLVQRKVGR